MTANYILIGIFVFVIIILFVGLMMMMNSDNKIIRDRYDARRYINNYKSSLVNQIFIDMILEEFDIGLSGLHKISLLSRECGCKFNKKFIFVEYMDNNIYYDVDSCDRCGNNYMSRHMAIYLDIIYIIINNCGIYPYYYAYKHIIHNRYLKNYVIKHNRKLPPELWNYIFDNF